MKKGIFSNPLSSLFDEKFKIFLDIENPLEPGKVTLPDQVDNKRGGIFGPPLYLDSLHIEINHSFHLRVIYIHLLLDLTRFLTFL